MCSFLVCGHDNEEWMKENIVVKNEFSKFVKRGD